MLHDTTVLLPVSAASWIIDQPDSVLSADESHFDSLQVDYTFPSPYAIRQPTHHRTVTIDLTRQIDNLVGAMVDEVDVALGQLWGHDDSNWTEICPWEDLLKVVTRMTNHMLIGLPYCRNDSLLDAAVKYSSDIPLSANILRLFPSFLRPLVAPLVTIPNNYHDYIFGKIMRPEIEKRLEDLKRSGLSTGTKESLSTTPEPQDFLQWTIRLALASPNPVDRTPRILAARMLSLNFAAGHTTAVGAVGVFFDLLASNQSERYIEELRDEARSVLASSGGNWSRSAVQRLYKLDSALRESHRLNTFNNLALRRVVMAKQGITAPGGTHLPYGTLMAISAYGIHRDELTFPNANEFRPFRFADRRSELQRGLDQSTDVKIQKAGTAFVTTSATFLPWGHGRHACPGRFFAATELKLLIATMLLDYEFELIPKQGHTIAERPKNMWVGDLLIPPIRAKARVRKRKQ